ncbi:3TM-type holin [Desulfatibacillum aliphaticivorans]|uniref:3TM-type holin n=1 Tax=Desulfatibacillum aliphaticivorans TaxID=218208 RepID=UPI0003F557C6|nr:3TM-type holin [Desulfatibacillum aliphaticivorans]
MDWKSVGKTIAKVGAPLLGTAVAGPAGGAALGTLVASLFGTDPDDPEALEAAINADPEAALKLRELELQNTLELQKLVVENARIESAERVTTIQEVNSTMRTEGKSEHWIQYSWRPFIGFCFPVTALAVYVILPLAHCEVPNVPDWIWLSFGAILGVTTWDRGKEKRAKAGEVAKPGIVSSVVSAIRGQG